MDKKKKYINLEDERAKKTIFGTTEKSNFILNMPIELVDKWLLGIISLAVILSAVGSFLTEFLKEINELPMMCFAIAGVMALIFALVVYQRRLYPKTVLAPTLIYGLMFILSLVTAFYGADVLAALKEFSNYFLYRDNSFVYNSLGIALKGYPGRGEGVFTFFCYICFFLIAVRLSHSNKHTEKLFDIFVFVGFLQCFAGLLQIIPFISNKLDFFYQNLYYSLFVDNVYLPNGTSASPIIFANFLAILTPITIIGGIKTESKKRKIFYTIATFLFVFFMLKSTTLIGIVGAILSLAVVIFFTKKLRLMILTTFAIIIGVTSCILVPELYDTGKPIYEGEQLVGYEERSLQLYDTGIIWEDSSVRIEATGFLKTAKVPFEKDSVFKTYQYMWDKTLKIATENPKNFLLGVGEEQLALAEGKVPQNLIVLKDNTFDKPYNDPLYILATRGIFALILYILFLIFAFKHSSFSGWQKKLCVISCGIYLILSLISFSAIETTPIFFVLLGLSWKNSKSEKITDVGVSEKIGNSSDTTEEISEKTENVLENVKENSEKKTENT
jgi:hypothetical protein